MKKIRKLLMLIVLLFIITSFGCKNENNTFENKGLDVKSTDGDLYPPDIVVHYKTEKRILDVGEDLSIVVSFGTILDYHKLDGITLKRVTAELLMKRTKRNSRMTDYEVVDTVSLKKIDDFSLEGFIGTFTSNENVVDVTIPSHLLDGSWDCVTFVLNVTEDYSTEDERDYTIDGGVGAALYYRIDGEKLKLYGSFYDFKNDII